MDDVELMGDAQSLAYLRADFGHFALVNGTAFVDGGFEVAAAHVLHDDVVGIVIMAPVVHVYNVGALQVGGCSGFLLETLGEAWVGCVLGQHRLDGDKSSEHVILCTVHFGHTADTDALGYLVAVVENLAYHGSGHVLAPLGHMCSAIGRIIANSIPYLQKTLHFQSGS